MENGTQNKPRKMYTLCNKTNVGSNGLCPDHKKRETSNGGKLAWTVPQYHEFRYVLVHPIHGFAFSMLVTKSQVVGFFEDLQLGDYRNNLRGPHYTADTSVHGGPQDVQRMHAVIASVENTEQVVEELLAVADATMDWLEGWPGRTLVTDDSYEGAYSASHREALAAAAALRKEAADLKSQLEASGGRALYVPGSKNKPECLMSCRTVSRVFEFGAPVGSETEIAGWNDKPKKALDALMAMIERLDATRLHLWAELSSVGFNSWEHLEDPKNVQTRHTLVSKLPGLVSAYGSLASRLSKMYRSVSKLLGAYRDAPQNGDEPVDGMRRPLISHTGSLLQWLDEISEATQTDMNVLLDLQEHMTQVFADNPLVAMRKHRSRSQSPSQRTLSEDTICTIEGCNNERFINMDGSSSLYCTLRCRSVGESQGGVDRDTHPVPICATKGCDKKCWVMGDGQVHKHCGIRHATEAQTARDTPTAFRVGSSGGLPEAEEVLAGYRPEGAPTFVEDELARWVRQDCATCTGAEASAMYKSTQRQYQEEIDMAKMLGPGEFPSASEMARLATQMRVISQRQSSIAREESLLGQPHTATETPAQFGMGEPPVGWNNYFYAVHSGSDTGIFWLFEDAYDRTNGVPNAARKKFLKFHEALAYYRDGPLRVTFDEVNPATRA